MAAHPLFNVALVGLLTTAAQAPALAGPPRVETRRLSGAIPSTGRLGGVAVDREGVAFVSNFGSSVYRVGGDGSVTLLVDTLDGASGNTVDAEGRLLQSSFNDNRVVRITSDGSAETIVDRGLDGPVGLVEGPQGRLFICNCRDGSIAVAEPGQAATRLVRSRLLACANGITWLSEDSLAVVTFVNDHVLSVRMDGTLDILATLPEGPGNAHIAHLGDDLYVTRARTNDIYRVSRDGSFERIAGNGEAGHRDGDASTALLSHPNGIAVEPGAAPSLLFNDLEGPWRGDEPTTIRLRRLRLDPGEESRP